MTDLRNATGRRVHHDPVSRAYAAAPLALPKASWRHTMGPVLNQARISGCTGWSGADILNSAKAIVARRRYNAAMNKADPHGVGTPPGLRHMNGYLTDADGLFIYEQATQNDNLGWTYPPTDNGSTGLGVAKALKKLGVITSYQWTFDFATMLAVAATQPVMLGTLWTDQMMEPDAKGVLHTGGAAAIAKAANNGEGHEYCLTGYNAVTHECRIRNHWTMQWGLSGDALIAATELEVLVIDNQGDVCVPSLV